MFAANRVEIFHSQVFLQLNYKLKSFSTKWHKLFQQFINFFKCMYFHFVKKIFIQQFRMAVEKIVFWCFYGTKSDGLLGVFSTFPQIYTVNGRTAVVELFVAIIVCWLFLQLNSNEPKNRHIREKVKGKFYNQI